MAVNLAEKVELDRDSAVRTLTNAVRTLRRHLLIRVPLVALLMMAWFVVSNHCALGLMKPTAQTAREHAGCHSHKTNPGEGSPADGVRECCKSIHVTLSAKAEVKFDASKFQLQLFIVHAIAAQLAQPAPTVFIFDHGPPRSLSFAEAVLQRSVLSHAPPLV